MGKKVGDIAEAQVPGILGIDFIWSFYRYKQ